VPPANPIAVWSKACHGERVSFSTSWGRTEGGLRCLIGEIAPGARLDNRSRAWLSRVAALAGVSVFAFLIMGRGGQLLHPIDRVLRLSGPLVAVAVGLETASVAGYVLLLHRVVGHADPRLRLKDSYDITMGGAAATRLLPTAGLGGAAVTVWALRARGISVGEIAERVLTFLLLLYGVYVAALLSSGALVASGWAEVPHGRTLGIVAVALATGITVVILGLLRAPARLVRMANRSAPRLRGLGPRLEASVAQLSVLRASRARVWQELRRPHPALLGAAASWGFDIAVLAVMLHAFGVRLPLTAVVLAYFLGTMLNVVPLPGSLSGGLASALIALGSPAGSAIAAVLAYRALAVWLPAAPGLAALAALRRSVSTWRIGPTQGGAPRSVAATPAGPVTR
jgi:uncharacterized membrane protein YbhN (UPF0104 family)